MAGNYIIPIPDIGFNPPTYICYPATREFCLDGNIFKDFWKDIPFTGDFTDISGPSKPSPRYRTRVKMAWDQDNLYIAALLEGDEIWATIIERDAVIFNDNDFEVFIDPDSDTQQYYEIEINALNTVWDLLLTKAYRDGGKPLDSWDIKGLKTAVHINGELNNPAAVNISWSVELVIPFKSLLECSGKNTIPSHGDYWRMNFSRVQWLTDLVDNRYVKKINPSNGLFFPEDNWVWAPTGLVNIHYPELWGFVFFSTSNKTSPFAIPDMEYRKWQLRKLYYLEHEFYMKHGCFTGDLSQLRAYSQRHTSMPRAHELCPEPLPYDIRIETTTHTFEITCEDAEGTGIIYLLSDGKTGFIHK